MVRTLDDVFIDVSDGVANSSKLRHELEGPYRVLGQDQRTMVIQRTEPIEGTIADWVTPAHQPSTVPPIPPEPAPDLDIPNKNFEGILWLFHGILDQHLKNEGQHEFQLKWVPTMRLQGNLATMY